MAIAALWLAGCGGVEMADTPASSPPSHASAAGITAQRVPDSRLNGAAALPTAPAERRLTRTIDKDPDGDGIADQRVVVTEIYNDAGALVQEIREEDFDADDMSR